MGAQIFEAMPFEFYSENGGEFEEYQESTPAFSNFEWEEEFRGRSPSRRAGSSSRTPRGGGPRFKRPVPPDRKRPKKPRHRVPCPPGRRPCPPRGIVGGPYGVVSEPYPLEPTLPTEPEPSGSERIRWVQDCLNQALELRLAVTGVMGPETRSAVRSFQKQQGLRASGIVGPDTEEALKAACGGRSTGVDGAGANTEEAELGPLTATLRWIGPPDNPTLLTRVEASSQSGGGVYIVVESGNGRTINRILKVGKAPSFRSRFGKDTTYRKPISGVPAENLRFYLANIVGFVDPHTHIEKAIARLLFRSGEQLYGSRYVASTPVAGRIELKNILPKPFLDRLLRAYQASGKDVRDKPIPKGSAPYRIYPDALILEPASFPRWEVSQAMDNTAPRNVIQDEESIMHHENCACPKCKMAGDLEWGQLEFPSFGEVYGEIGLESPFSEAEEMELAAELLSVSNEEELEQFLGKLVKGAWKGIKKVGKFVGKVAKPLGGVLKGVAKAALPFVGGALGSFIPIPGVGTALGSALGGALSKALELEFGEFEQEEQEFEKARRFVRIAGTAAQQAALASPTTDPQAAVKSALIAAARRHVGSLPDVATGGNGMTGAAPGSAHSGRWVRRGREIIVLGV